MFGTFNYWFYMIFTAPQQLPSELTGWAARLSIPARIAWLMFLFEIVAVTAFAVFYFTNPELTPISSSVGWWIIPTIGFLMVIIPVVTYQTVRVWLEGRAALFPDIDEAWKAGLQELDRRRIRLDQYPLYLVFGAVGEGLEKHIFKASKLSFDLEAFPALPNAPLRWYFGEKGIFISVTGAGAINDYLKQADASLGKKGEVSGPRRRGGGDGIRDTMSVDGPSDDGGERGGGGGYTAPTELTRTLLPGGGGGSSGVRDTMGLTAPGITDTMGVMMPGGGGAQDVAKVTRSDFQEQQLRLEYFCRLLNKSRLPFISVNGMMAVVPLHAIEFARQQGKNGGVRLHTAVSMDMEAANRALQVRSPLRVLVSGMEGERGFREMVSRMGRMLDANFRDQPFGKGSDPWAQPSDKQMNALTQHACGAFEDWIFNLFKHKDAVQNPRNRLLFSLLCKVRRILREPLSEILSKGFGIEDVREAGRTPPPLVCGCYFAGTGPAENEQVFVSGAYNKMLAQEQDVEWLQPAIDSDRRYHKWANFVVFLNVSMFLGLIGIVAYKLWFA